MKKALNAWTVDPAAGMEDMFEQVKRAGFDGIELNVDKPGASAHALSMETTAAELDAIAALSEKYALPVVSISSSLHGGMGSSDPDDRKFSADLIFKQISIAKRLGATGILAVPGSIGDGNSIASAYDYSFKTLEECADRIAGSKIYVGLENVWNAFFSSPYDMCSLIDKLNCEYISAYYDVGNTVAFSWTEYWIDILRSRISHVHIKDFKRGGGIHRGGEFVDLTLGDINWKKVMNAFRDIGFDGYLTAEVFKADADQPYEAYYREVAEAADRILAM